MPFAVKSNPAAPGTFIDVAEATENDRLRIILWNGEVLVFKLELPTERLVCDRPRSSESLLEDLATACLAKLAVRREFRRPPSLKQVVTRARFVLIARSVTRGHRLHIRVAYESFFPAVTATRSRIRSIESLP